MSRLLISESPLTFQPSLAVAIGLNEAIVLQQIHYWISNSKNKGYEQDGFKWVYNTYAEWKETNFQFWSENTIQRVFASLEEMGLVVSIQPMKYKYDRTKYYRIDYTKLDAFENTKMEAIEDPKMVPSLNESENTAETTQQERADALLSEMPIEAQIMAGVERVTIPRSQIITNGLRDFFKLTPRWSSRYDKEWMQWAIEVEMTAEQIEFAADKWRNDKRFNWGVPTLKGIAEHWLELRGDKDEEPERPEYQKFQAPKDEVYAPPPPRKR